MEGPYHGHAPVALGGKWTDPSSRLEEADDHHAARLAVRLVLSGFRNVDDLEGLPPSAIERLTNVPKEQAML